AGSCSLCVRDAAGHALPAPLRQPPLELISQDRDITLGEPLIPTIPLIGRPLDQLIYELLVSERRQVIHFVIPPGLQSRRPFCIPLRFSWACICRHRSPPYRNVRRTMPSVRTLGLLHHSRIFSGSEITRYGVRTARLAISKITSGRA